MIANPASSTYRSSSASRSSMSLAAAVDPRVAQRIERYRNLLAETPLFRGLSMDAIGDFSRRVHVRTCAAGGLVVSQDEPNEALFVLVTGRAKVALLGETGRELLLRTLEPGDAFGELSLVDEGPRAASVVATSESTMLVIGRDALRTHLIAYPQTALNLMTELSRRLRQADETIADLALFDVETRLARVLERLARESREPGEPPPRGVSGVMLARRPTQQDLANMTGSCRETISRTFSSLVRRGLLVPRGRALLITTELLRRAGRAPRLAAI